MPVVFDQPAAQAMMLDSENTSSGLRHTAFLHPDGASPLPSPPPHYAEHTPAILRERFGYSPERIDALAKENVIAR